jgi:hypothetical protein
MPINPELGDLSEAQQDMVNVQSMATQAAIIVNAMQKADSMYVAAAVVETALILDEIGNAELFMSMVRLCQTSGIKLPSDSEEMVERAMKSLKKKNG